MMLIDITHALRAILNGGNHIFVSQAVAKANIHNAPKAELLMNRNILTVLQFTRRRKRDVALRHEIMNKAVFRILHEARMSNTSSDNVYIALCPDAPSRQRIADIANMAKAMLGENFTAQHSANIHLTIGKQPINEMATHFPLSPSENWRGTDR